jgi:hypothetical protein
MSAKMEASMCSATKGRQIKRVTLDSTSVVTVFTFKKSFEWQALEDSMQSISWPLIASRTQVACIVPQQRAKLLFSVLFTSACEQNGCVFFSSDTQFAVGIVWKIGTNELSM